MQLKVPPAPPLLQPPLGEADHRARPAGRRITLVEYGDFQCPHCGAAVEVIAELLRDAGEDLLFAFRHFPLAKMHPHARRGRRGVGSGGGEGKFWEMHDLLFAHQEELELDDLLAYAGQLGLDVDRVRAEMASHAYAVRLQEDIAGGIRSGVNGTPTFFSTANGRTVMIATWLNAAVEQALIPLRNNFDAGSEVLRRAGFRSHLSSVSISSPRGTPGRNE